MDNCHTLQSFFVFLNETGRIKDDVMTAKAIKSLSKSVGEQNILLSSLSEAMVKAWVDGILPKLTIASIIRYVESLRQVYKHAIRLGLVADNNIFDCIKEYVAGMSDEGFDKASQSQISAIRKLARVKIAATSSMSHAVDAYMFSFFHAGIDIQRVIELKIDDDQLCDLAQTQAIKRKYAAPIRKYVFPLHQWQRTTNQIKNRLESNFLTYLKIEDIRLGKKSPTEFISTAWVAAAKACGVSPEDICACCPSIAGNAKLKKIEPSSLSQPQIDAIKAKVANSIIDMNRHWYAIRFTGKEERVRKEIEQLQLDDDIKIYYPIEEICKRVGKKRVVENRPTIRNILFLNAMPATLDTIMRKRTVDSKFYAVRNMSTEANAYAIIPNEQMRKFSLLVSNGLDILGDEEINQSEILEGSYVHINEGLFKGYSGRVIKVRNQDSTQATMLQIEAEKFGPEMQQILGKHIYITIPQSIVSCPN